MKAWNAVERVRDMNRKRAALFGFTGFLLFGVLFGAGDAQTADSVSSLPTLPSLAQPAGQPTSHPQGANDAYGTAQAGGAREVSQGTTSVLIDSDAAVTAEMYASQNTDENAVRIAGPVTALMDQISIEKSGNTENGDACKEYGQNAGLLATGGASVSVTGATVHTDGSGANGVFAYGDGTAIHITDSALQTQMDHSDGMLASGGGSLNADNLTIETHGDASAAIRVNRGGGNITVNGGTYATYGADSPALDARATATVASATLSAAASAAIVVEGTGSAALTDCTITSDMQATGEADSGANLHAVMLYRSQSSDAEMSRSNFSMTGGSLTAQSGDLFYITNTACTLELTDVALSPENGNLLTVAGNDASVGWGRQGSNGGDCILTADSQTLSGTVTVDTISALTLALQNGSSFTGAVNPDGQAGTVEVILDATSTWTLTADAYVTTFSGDLSQVVTNGFTLHVAEPTSTALHG